MDTRPIRFLHRGRRVEVDGVAPTRTLLDWLREDARRTGTKEGCAEGDCGACTVIVGRLDGSGRVALETVNACLLFLPTLDGRALLTVEDLGDGTALHPAQQALVSCHGSQCGFCTPGFVMSLAAVHERHAAAGTRPTRAELADALAGNLCRCTGYRPILDAGERMLDLTGPRLPVDMLAEPLRALQADPPLAYAHEGGRFDAPHTLDDFAARRQAQPEARVLAGGTDVALWVNKQFRGLGDLLYVGRVGELLRVDTLADGTLRVGAAVPLEAAWSALVARWPRLEALWLRFASPPVRHAGTLGGNLANGSPIGDGAPVLMALGARLVLRRGASQRTLPLDAFYVDYMTNRLEPGEFIEAVELPPAGACEVRAYKVAKRFDSDISAVCGAFAVVLDGGLVREARFAFGGLAATVRRATGAEAAVLGRPWTEDTLEAAIAALADDFTPLTDLRASAAYRRHVAGQLLRRCWLETRPDDPLPPAALDVWHDVRNPDHGSGSGSGSGSGPGLGAAVDREAAA